MARFYTNLGNLALAWRLAVLAAFSLCAWLALGERAAIASCGDYVKVANPQFPMADHASSAAATPSNRESLPIPPCNGPQCRGSVPLAPAPAPVVVRTVVEQLGILTALSDSKFASRGASLTETGAQPAAGYRALLERPPRA